MRILVTGVTGYIGSNLVPQLLDDGHDVSVLVRDPQQLEFFEWVSKIKIFVGDARNKDAVDAALNEVEVAYYLIHSMRGSSNSFHHDDIKAAESFGQSAASNSVCIIFLGALGNPDSLLTSHLKSRHATGKALAKFSADVIELRAGPVVGAGSLPFEMVRYLTERVPIMICPRWVFTQVQPIGLGDALEYLVSSLNISQQGHQVIEIGGSEVLSYGEMMTGYAKERGLKRAMIRVPVLTPRLSSYWVHWVTPLKASFARPLVEGLRSEVVLRSKDSQQIFPRINPLGYRDSVRIALQDLNPDKLNYNPLARSKFSKSVQRGMIVETRKVEVSATVEEIFQAFCSLGGSSGWYLNWGWRLRGFIDRIFGGIGLRKGRPDGMLSVGDAVDFWRVQSIERNSRLLLRAEMKVPGNAWLEFRVIANGETNTLVQQSYFAPKGSFGIIYWYALLPIHRIVFDGLAKRVAYLASRKHRSLT